MLVRSVCSCWFALHFLAPDVRAWQHYERPPCAHDEIQGEVLGASGYTCSPRCAENTYDCPTDVPDLANARPQCMLKDVDRGAYCALLCSADYQCPNGARCQHLQQAGAGICMYPLSFTDWVRQGTSRRLSFGLPQRADQQLPPGIVQKAVTAVQNLKSKFAIPDGDTDIVTVKDFLSKINGGAPLPFATGSISGSASVSPAASVVPAASVAPPQPQPASSGSSSVWGRDFNYATSRLMEGLPGLEKEFDSTLNKIEHITERNKATELFRGVLEVAVLYLVIGAIYKHQALGARGVDMIPHIGFWMEYPQLVNDGIIYSKQLVGEFFGISMDSGSFGRGGLGSGFEPMGGPDRDTFANFEPMGPKL